MFLVLNHGQLLCRPSIFAQCAKLCVLRISATQRDSFDHVEHQCQLTDICNTSGLHRRILVNQLRDNREVQRLIIYVLLSV